MGLWARIKAFLAKPKGTDHYPGDLEEALEFMNMAALAYDDDNKIKAKFPRNDVEIIELKDSKVKFFHGIDHDNNVQWVSVRGTANLDNFKTDMEYTKEKDPIIRIYLHKGFQDAAEAAWKKLKMHLVKDMPINVTGHSLGGAIANILAMYMKKKKLPLQKCITFGQPKVTNHKGVWKYRRIPLVRFVHKDDPVPLVPPITFITSRHGFYIQMGAEVHMIGAGQLRCLNRKQSADMRSSMMWDKLDDLDVKDHKAENYIKAIIECIKHRKEQ